MAALAVVGVLPLCFMVAGSFADARNYTETLASTRTWTLFRNSVILASLTTITTGVAGVALGILFAKTDLPLREALTAVFALPLLFPPYVLAVGWFEVLGRGGALAQWLGSDYGETSSRWLFALPGIVLVLSTAFLPVVLLLTITCLRSVSSSLEQAGRLTSGWPAVLRNITIPLAWPGILLSLVLVFLLAMGEFGAPAFLRFAAFPVASFTQFTAFYNFGAATAAALPLLLVAMLGLAIEQRLLEGRSFQFGWRDQKSDGSIALRRLRAPLCAVAALSALTLVGVPMGALLWRGLNSAALNEAIERAGASAIRSVAYSAVSATVIAVVGFFLAYLIHRRAIVGWRWVDAATIFLFTLPGTVIGIGIIALWNRPSTNWIYSTPAILVTGYVAQYVALGTRAILAGFAQTPPGMEEAAEVAGASWARRVSEVLVPLLWSPITVSWAVAFLFCLRDVSLPLLLAPAGHDTLTARTMTLMANGSPELIAALCLLLISLAVIPLGVAGLGRRIMGRAR